METLDYNLSSTPGRSRVENLVAWECPGGRLESMDADTPNYYILVRQQVPKKMRVRRRFWWIMSTVQDHRPCKIILKTLWFLKILDFLTIALPNENFHLWIIKLEQIWRPLAHILAVPPDALVSKIWSPGWLLWVPEAKASFYDSVVRTRVSKNERFLQSKIQIRGLPRER